MTKLTKPPVPRAPRQQASRAGEASRRQILEAARAAFAERGFEGARVDDIASRAGINKQLLYHHFGNKDALYAAVLAEVYGRIRAAEQALALDALPAEEALRRLIEFSFNYLLENPDFVKLIADENAQGGRHLAGHSALPTVNRPILDLLRRTLERGVAEGVFRRGIDPLHLYLSVAGMAFFFFSNNHTLGRAFGRDFADPKQVDERRAHIVDLTLNAVRAR